MAAQRMVVSPLEASIAMITPYTEKKLEKLRAWILAEPRRYCQRFWGYHGTLAKKHVKHQLPPCKTIACLGGNALLMEGFKLFQKNGRLSLRVPERAAKILGLNS